MGGPLVGGSTWRRWIWSSSSGPAGLIRRAFSAEAEAEAEAAAGAPDSDSGGRSHSPPPPRDPKKWALFEWWMSAYERTYQSDEERLRRFKIFCETADRVEKMNQKKSGCTFRVGPFADLNHHEVPNGRGPSFGKLGG